MEIKILGTRGEIEETSPTHKKHSGVLIDSILFDLGEKEYLDLKPKAILVTHAHPDHFALKEAYEIPLYGPKEVIEKARKLGWKEEFLHKVEPGQAFVIGEYTIIPIPTIHSKKVTSFGYVVEK